MSTGADTGGDIDRLLAEAGAAWRSRQVFEAVVVSPEALEVARRDGRSVSAMLARATGSVAVAAIVLAVFALAPQVQQRPGIGSDQQPSPVMPATPPSVTAVPSSDSTTPSADELEAMQLDVIEAVKNDPVNFGGVYLDENDQLVILYVGANAGRAAVEEKLLPGVTVRWQEVDRSRADLMRMLREISDRNLDGVVMIGIDTINNQVEVTVDPSERVPELSRSLGAEYGDAVAVVAGEPVVVLPWLPSPSPSE